MQLRIRHQTYGILIFLGLIFGGMWMLTGCISTVRETKRIGEPEFEIVEKDAVPEEFARVIREEREKPFCLTYADQGELYLARGYGRQDKTGYSVEVSELYETENAVVFHTRLMGPEKSEKTKEIATYPYVVVRMKDGKKSVEFD